MNRAQTIPDFRNILKEAFAARLRADASYNMKKFATSLGFTAARLSSILGGREGLSAEAALRVAGALEMSAEDTEYFCDLVEAQHARSAQQRALAVLRLQRRAATGSFHIVVEDTFKMVSEWYHFPMLELVGIEGFKEDSEWIARALRITSQEAQEALERLLRLGLLDRDEKGSLRKTNLNLSTGDSVPSEAIRYFHKQILARAIDSVDLQGLEQRSLSANFLAVDKNSLEKAKEKLRRFRRKFAKEFSSSKTKTAVYCLSMQLFSIAEASSCTDDLEESDAA